MCLNRKAGQGLAFKEFTQQSFFETPLFQALDAGGLHKNKMVPSREGTRKQTNSNVL